MAEQIKKDNRGYLYPNGNKTKPTHPDYTGTLVVENKDWRLAAWENQSTADGKKYLSIIVSPPLSPEQQTQFKRGDEPLAAPAPVSNPPQNNSQHNTPINTPNTSNNNNNNNSNNSNQNNHSAETQNNSDYYNDKLNSPSNDLDDLDAILRSNDDDNPFS